MREYYENKALVSLFQSSEYSMNTKENPKSTKKDLANIFDLDWD